MAENTSLSNEQKKTALAQKLWLAYYNSYLYENGMITETQRNRMIAKIDSRKPSIRSQNKSLNKDYTKE